jgi:mannose-6-phosphate isomerase-like protein (cupin superfamily)
MVAGITLQENIVPVLRGDMRNRPYWCELEEFTVVALGAGESRTWEATHPANKLIAVEGECAVELGSGNQTVGPGRFLDTPPGSHLVSSTDGATLVELGGRWGEEVGGAGVFVVETSDEPDDVGDPVTYPKNTRFDRHYHDCDEYWILVKGSGTASSEDVLYEVGPGDCVATRMGHHHDFPLVEEPVLAVFFETTMRGRKRLGHLWEHTHGPAEPEEIQ